MAEAAASFGAADMELQHQTGEHGTCHCIAHFWRSAVALSGCYALFQSSITTNRMPVIRLPPRLTQRGGPGASCDVFSSSVEGSEGCDLSLAAGRRQSEIPAMKSNCEWSSRLIAHISYLMVVGSDRLAIDLGADRREPDLSGNSRKSETFDAKKVTAPCVYEWSVRGGRLRYGCAGSRSEIRAEPRILD